MSVVNPDYVVGKMTTINPKAKTLKDLSSKEMDLYQENVVNQYEDYLTGFYKGVKDKAGNRMYSNEDIIDMTDYLRFGTGGGEGRNAPGMLKGMEEPYVPKNPADRKNFAEGDFVTSDDTAFERFLKEGNFKQKAKNIFGKTLKGAGTVLNKGVLGPLTAIEAPSLALPQSAFELGNLIGDVKRGEKTDASAIGITAPTALSYAAASKQGLDLFADNAGKIKKA